MPQSSQLKSITKSPLDLSENHIASLFSLFSNYYDDCRLNQFTSDLLEKDYVLYFIDEAGSIKGFTTALIMHFENNKQACQAIFSGDTIIHHDYWGSQTLPLAWCRLAGSIKKEKPDNPLYWFLIVKGHRTYRYLPIFSKQFFPTWRQPTPSYIKEIMDKLATQRFGDDYIKDKGIIHFKTPKGRLNKDWVNIPQHLKNKQDVGFFLKNNPNYYKGDELVCITELSSNNLKSFALKAFQGGLSC